jgi:7,8-dihydro-6-hydroxymethylpterin-pyrophosphokinase
VETALDPLGLLNELQSIETVLDRKKIIDKGPRNIDLDILLYDNEAVDHPRLKIPHPGMYEREFVLRPLSEYVDLDSWLRMCTDSLLDSSLGRRWTLHHLGKSLKTTSMPFLHLNHHCPLSRP